WRALALRVACGAASRVACGAASRVACGGARRVACGGRQESGALARRGRQGWRALARWVACGRRHGWRVLARRGRVVGLMGGARRREGFGGRYGWRMLGAMGGGCWREGGCCCVGGLARCAVLGCFTGSVSQIQTGADPNRWATNGSYAAAGPLLA